MKFQKFNLVQRVAIFSILLFTAVINTSYAENARHDFPYKSHYIDVFGSKMHYIDTGGPGSTIVMIHGQPTWSYLWRNIIPHLEGNSRVIALDLIGFGKSDQPDIAYSVEDHARYLEAFIEQLGLKNIRLIMHDWGGFLGLDYAYRNPGNVSALAFMESAMNVDSDIAAVMQPFVNDPSVEGIKIIMSILDPEHGRKRIFENNIFIEKLMPNAVVTPFTEDELNAYREPFAEGRNRLPMYMFPMALKGPPYVVNSIEKRGIYLSETETPALLLTFSPGGLIRAPQISWAKQHIKNLTVQFIGEGRHYVQEDHPDTIGKAISGWLESSAPHKSKK